jgi:hypothetical protein
MIVYQYLKNYLLREILKGYISWYKSHDPVRNEPLLDEVSREEMQNATETESNSKVRKSEPFEGIF